MALTKAQRVKRRERGRRWQKNNPEKARQSHKRWYENNPEKASEWARLWRKNNPERARKTSKLWRKNNPEKVIQAARLWRKNNPENVLQGRQRWRKANPEKCRQATKRWRENNPEKNLAYNQKRRAHIFSNGGEFTPAEWLALKKFHGNRCLCCGLHQRTLRKLGRTLTPDHVLPIARGGRNEIKNIQPLCHGRGGCNNSKNVKHIDYRK